MSVPVANELPSLPRGEKTAAIMETQLTILERRIDELLASVDLPNELEPIPKEEEMKTVIGTGASVRDGKELETSEEEGKTTR